MADGMGISLLPPRAVTSEHRVLDEADGLPVIDSYEILILHRQTADPMVRALADVLKELLQARAV